MVLTTKKGRLEVICGSMFSGKSEELIRRLRRAEFARFSTQVFKHTLDHRKTISHIHAHNGDKLLAVAVDDPLILRGLVLPDVQVIAIDEVQFFSSSVSEVLQNFVDEGKLVITAGLDLDFRGVPFGCMPQLLALADSVTKLKAICMVCGKDAHFTQRLINNQPARIDDPIVLIGAQECYQARCRDCHIIDKKVV
jgi:thymidine kinase